MKRLFVFLLVVSLMIGLTACAENKPVKTDNDIQPITSVTQETYKGTEQRVAVFDTENIKRITLITKYGYGEKYDVSDEDMAEMTAWLGTFTLDEVIDENIPIAPGTNTIWVEIEYADGTVIKNGLDTATVDGVTYYIESDPKPQCYYDILNIKLYP